LLQEREKQRLLTIGSHQENSMSTKVIALLAATLLTTAEYLVFEYDAQQRVVQYQAEVNGAALQHG